MGTGFLERPEPVKASSHSRATNRSSESWDGPVGMPAVADTGRGHCLPCALPLDRQAVLNEELTRGVSLQHLSKKYSINRGSLRTHRDRHLTPSW